MVSETQLLETLIAYGLLLVVCWRLSAPIHNYGNKLAVIFFPTRALSVEWIRFLISFIGQAGFTG